MLFVPTIGWKSEPYTLEVTSLGTSTSRSVNVGALSATAGDFIVIINQAGKVADSPPDYHTTVSGWEKPIVSQAQSGSNGDGSGSNQEITAQAFYKKFTGAEGTINFAASGADRYHTHIYKISTGAPELAHFLERSVIDLGDVGAEEDWLVSGLAAPIVFFGMFHEANFGVSARTFSPAADLTGSSSGTIGSGRNMRLETRAKLFAGALEDVELALNTSSDVGSQASILSGFALGLPA